MMHGGVYARRAACTALLPCTLGTGADLRRYGHFASRQHGLAAHARVATERHPALVRKIYVQSVDCVRFSAVRWSTSLGDTGADPCRRGRTRWVMSGGKEVNMAGRSSRANEAARSASSQRRTERGSDDEQVRLSLKVNSDVADVFKGYADRYGVTVTEAVRRAATALKFVDETQGRGATVAVKDGETITEVRFM